MKRHYLPELLLIIVAVLLLLLFAYAAGHIRGIGQVPARKELVMCVVDSVPGQWRNESIKAYGNAIVPQVAYQIFKAIDKFISPTEYQSGE